MLKNEYVDFLGTDIHHVIKTYVTDNFKKIEKLFNKFAGKDYSDLTTMSLAAFRTTEAMPFLQLAIAL